MLIYYFSLAIIKFILIEHPNVYIQLYSFFKISVVILANISFNALFTSGSAPTEHYESIS